MLETPQSLKYQSVTTLRTGQSAGKPLNRGTLNDYRKGNEPSRVEASVSKRKAPQVGEDIVWTHGKP